MIAVSNTTPLRYLLAIHRQDILQKLFEKVLIPRAVLEELTDLHTPELVRNTLSSPPEWIRVQDAGEWRSEFRLNLLHRGEKEAICLAEMVRPDFLLLDDQAARSEALRRELPVTGTLGVLERGDLLGLIPDFPLALENLKASGFFLSATLEELLKARHKRRMSRPG